MPKPPNRYRPRFQPPPERRDSANTRGYNKRWQKASKQYLALNPLCVYCGKRGIVTAATCVDHIIPHKGDNRLFWDQSNWAASCIPCNSRKGDKELTDG